MRRECLLALNVPPTSSSADKSPIDCLIKTYRTEGFLGWYKGSLAHLMRIAPHTVRVFSHAKAQLLRCVAALDGALASARFHGHGADRCGGTQVVTLVTNEFISRKWTAWKRSKAAGIRQD